jgi:hypothetical protein
MIGIVGVSRAAVMATGAVATGLSSANDSLHLQTPLRRGRLLLAARPVLEITALNIGSVLPPADEPEPSHPQHTWERFGRAALPLSATTGAVANVDHTPASGGAVLGSVFPLRLTSQSMQQSPKRLATSC